MTLCGWFAQPPRLAERDEDDANPHARAANSTTLASRIPVSYAIVRVEGIAARRLALCAIVVVGGFFRFDGLKWGEHGWPHPDERAVISQTYDLLVADEYRPTIHTWGHFAYYSTLFSYKAYVQLRQQLPSLPAVREVAPATLTTLGISLSLLLYLGAIGIASLTIRVRLMLALVAMVVVGISWRSITGVMAARITPEFTDVAITGRFIAALVSTLSLPLVYALGARLYSPMVGLLAAALFAVTVRATQLAHFFAVEPLQTFSVLLALLSAAMVLRLDETKSSQPRFDVTAVGLFIALGLAIGMAMSSKFSSAPLFALPFVVFLLLAHRRVVSPLALHGALALCFVSACAMWFALHRYAWELPFVPFASAQVAPVASERWLQILFSRDFAAQIAEQSRMIAGNGGGPWVQQFADTTPYVTMTMEMVRWSFGWPLGILCVGGFLYAIARNLFKPAAADLLLLSYGAITFFIMAGFKATFPRYTLPILPIVCLFGARACLSLDVLTARLRLRLSVAGVVAAVAIASGVLSCLAYTRVYAAPHAWTAASLWMFKNVPLRRADGQPTRIAHEEWDDEIPLSVAPHLAQYGRVMMSPYHGDGDDKATTLAAALGEADWIALPTPRLYSTILKVEDRYPVTASYYRLLFAGELGFTLRTTIYQPPQVWRVRFDDLSADESHYVYDHPKAVVFEKTESLAADEIARRIVAESRRPPRFSRAELLAVREAIPEQIDNLWRDPYAGRAVVTGQTIAAMLAAVRWGTDDDRRRLLARVPSLATRPVVRAVDVKGVTARFTSAGGPPDIAQLSAELARLPTDAAYDARELAALMRDHAIVYDAEAGDRLARFFEHDIASPHLDRAALLTKAAAIAPLRPLPTSAAQGSERDQIRDVPLQVEASGGPGWEIWQAVKWVLLIELLGFVALPLTLWLFASFPDRGYPLARTIGLVLTTYVACAIAVVTGVPFGPLTCASALAILAIGLWLTRRPRQVLAQLPPRRIILATEGLFVAAFAGFALVRAFNPAIFWGEKTMDFSLLNAVLRSGSLPPYEPWFAGVALNYYYYGYFLIGTLARLTATPTAIAFNLAMAVIPALTIVTAFSLTLLTTKRIGWALVGALFVGIAGNLDAAFQLAESGGWASNVEGMVRASIESYGRVVGSVVAVVKSPAIIFSTLFTDPAGGQMWDSFWASSRALGEGMINEYPVWSWLFADLHAHVIVMPVSLLALALIALVFQSRVSGVALGAARAAALVLLLAVVMGTLLATNTWDFIAYVGVMVAALAVVALLERRSNPRVATRFDPFHESRAHVPAQNPSWRLAALLLAVWVLLWPWLCRLHPYWLGLFGDRTIGLLVGVALLAASYAHEHLLRATDALAATTWRTIRRAGPPVMAVLVVTVLLFFAFVSNLETNSAATRFNTDGNITAAQAFRHFGVFVFISVVWAMVMQSIRPRLAIGPVIGVAAVVGFLAATGWWQSAGGAALYVSLLVAVGFGALAAPTVEERWLGVLLVCGWGLAAVAEVIVVTDRMNTVFKFYHPVWMLVAIGSAGAVATLADRWPAQPVLWRRGSALVLLVMLTIALAGTYRGVAGVLTRNLKASSTPTLNGLDFLRHTEDERELLEATTWLNQHADGRPVVAENFTNRGYDESARVAKYTGLPILLGWPHHLSQRGRAPSEVAQRARDLDRLYTTRDNHEFAKLAAQYRVRYLLVGDLERDHYKDSEAALRALTSVREVFRSASGRYVIFEVAPAS